MAELSAPSLAGRKRVPFALCPLPWGRLCYKVDKKVDKKYWLNLLNRACWVRIYEMVQFSCMLCNYKPYLDGVFVLEVVP